MITNKLLNDLITQEANSHSWPGWRAKRTMEIFAISLGTSVIGGLGVFDGSNIHLIKVISQSIVCINSLHFYIQTKAVQISPLAVNYYTRFYKYPNTNDTLIEPSDIDMELIYTDTTDWYYKLTLKTPIIFFVDNETEIGLTSYHNSPAYLMNQAFGQAIIINSL